MGRATHLLAHSVLVDGPDRGHVRGQQLVLRQGGVAGAGADEAGLPHRVVPDDHTFDGLDVGPLIVHIRNGRVRSVPKTESPRLGLELTLHNPPQPFLRTYCMLYVLALKNSTSHCVASGPSYLCCIMGMV